MTAGRPWSTDVTARAHPCDYVTLVFILFTASQDGGATGRWCERGPTPVEHRARQLFALQAVVVTLLVLAGAAGAVWLARSDPARPRRSEVLARGADRGRLPRRSARPLATADPAGILQPYAERVRARPRAPTSWWSWPPTGTRYTHPDPGPDRRAVRRPHRARPARAAPFTETYTGTLGASVRAVVPVYDEQRRIVGLVSVGITTPRPSTSKLLRPAAGAARLSPRRPSRSPATGSWLVSRRLRRQTHGLGAGAADPDVRVLRRGAARRARGAACVLDHRRPGGAGQRRGPAAAGPRADDAGGRPAGGRDSTCRPLVAELLGSGRDARDELHVDRRPGAGGQPGPARCEGAALGTVVTLRDHTELQALTGELDSVRGSTEALRSQAHESANRLHTVVSLIELGRADEAVRLRHRGAARSPSSSPTGWSARWASRRWPRCCSARPRRPASAAWSCVDRRRTPPRRQSAADRRPA